MFGVDFESSLSQTIHYYVVGPANRVRVVLTERADKANNYTSIEDCDPELGWQHRPDSSRGHGAGWSGKKAALQAAKSRWEELFHKQRIFGSVI